MNAENARKLRIFPSFRALFQVANHSEIGVLSQRLGAALKPAKSPFWSGFGTPTSSLNFRLGIDPNI
jgi:hypothetical protein